MDNAVLFGMKYKLMNLGTDARGTYCIGFNVYECIIFHPLKRFERDDLGTVQTA